MSPTDIFIKHNVLLAHCSSMAQMVGNKDTHALDPFEKLDRILNDELSPRIEISCSTIGLSDIPMTHFTGNFGLILKPHSFSSITHISNTDGGTEPSGDGRTRSGINRKNSPDDLEDAIANRVDTGHPLYNEICVKNYDILGLFVALNSSDTQLHSILNHFKHEPNLFQLKCDGSELIDLKKGRSLTISELYSSGE
jgi:hypothetical protein